MDTIKIDNSLPYVNQFNFVHDLKKEEKISPISLTMPDQAFTIKEILEKFTNGVPPELTKLPQYQENPDFDSYDETLDPAFDLSDATIRLAELNTEKILLEKQIEQNKAVVDTTAKETSE